MTIKATGKLSKYGGGAGLRGGAIQSYTLYRWFLRFSIHRTLTISSELEVIHREIEGDYRIEADKEAREDAEKTASALGIEIEWEDVTDV